LSKEEIIKELDDACIKFIEFCTEIDTTTFYFQPAEKWSIAQNVEHLVISANTTRLAFSLPKFVVKLYAGKPNRPSRTYDELVNKYKMKLQQGGKASGRFIPQKIREGPGQIAILETFKRAMTKLKDTIEKKWNDSQLDQYIAPHPLLGKITLRELCYFTIHHTYHHLAIIKERNSESVNH
jgi:uncharacterized damage-inducible protein DinB